MQRIQLQEDIQPLSEFRSKVAFYLEKVNKDKRPLVITQNGKSAAILLGVSEYDSLIEKIEILEDIKLSESQVAKRLGVNHSVIKKSKSK
ncbi:MAG: type II toxin-antitoxin system Phd/YefM family antitoxin [Bacteroidia bacterium]|nr:type II toxin-antitoxin system Phd/YefM family antitoxin [Bacteroidia bacterium]